MRLLSKRPKVTIGTVIVLAMIMFALIGPQLIKFQPFKQDLGARLTPPMFSGGGIAKYPLGSDQLGRDILSRLMTGARISLMVGGLAVTFNLIIGGFLGVVAGFYRGKLDLVIMKLVDFFMSLPWLVIAIAVMAFLGQSLRNLILILATTRWVPYCRQIRGEILSLKQREYVLAARALGASDVRLMVYHLLVNTVSSITVIATFNMATMILSEASLSFLGVGVPPSTPTWGLMLSESRNYLVQAWWLAVLPGLFIFITVLGINLLGDGLRDWVDPRMK